MQVELDDQALIQVLTREPFQHELLPIRKQKTRCFQRVFMKRMKGLEPSTFCMQGRRRR